MVDIIYFRKSSNVSPPWPGTSNGDSVSFHGMPSVPDYVSSKNSHHFDPQILLISFSTSTPISLSVLSGPPLASKTMSGPWDPMSWTNKLAKQMPVYKKKAYIDEAI